MSEQLVLSSFPWAEHSVARICLEGWRGRAALPREFVCLGRFGGDHWFVHPSHPYFERIVSGRQVLGMRRAEC